MNLPGDDFTARLRSYVRRRIASASDADDVVQTVVLRLLSDPMRNQVPPPAWLLAAARTAIADHYRTRTREEDSLAEPAMVPGAEADARSDVTECLAPLLAGLADEDRVLLQRVDLEGASQADLAREMSLSASAMKSRVQRARARLRSALIARCEFERDSRGSPVGPATCRPSPTNEDCACRGDGSDSQECG